MKFEKQPVLEDELIIIRPLKGIDFEQLYKVASDPEIWIQHPNKDRYKKEVFINFFEGAIESKGAFLVTEKESGEVIGSSRYYDLPEFEDSVAIGYTFLAKRFWGTTYNRTLKILMLDHAFKFIDTVYFHIGKVNIRSQKAIEKLGADKIGQKEMNYFGEDKSQNLVYKMEKSKWNLIKKVF